MGLDRSHLRLALLLLIPLSLGCQGRPAGGNTGRHTVAPCPMPRVDVKSWLSVEQRRFTFRIPPNFSEVKGQNIDSWGRMFQSTDSTVSLIFDWGQYSDPLTKARYGVTSCAERIGGQKARLIALSLPNPSYGVGDAEAKYCAGVAWRDIKPGVHLTMFGWARDRNGLDQLLRIFRTVRFEESD